MGLVPQAVADFVNLFIASVYIAMVDVGGVLTPVSFLHIASLIWLPQFLSRPHGTTHCELAGQEWSNWH